MSTIKIEGYLDNERVEPSLFSGFDGMRLDELYIDVKVGSKEDCEDFIKFLNIHKHCFEKIPKE